VDIYVEKGKLRCNAPTPNLLHTCSEARRQALLTSYQPLIFDGIHTGSYVNFEIDVIFFNTDLPVIKVFCKYPAFPIFQQCCRYLAIKGKPLGLYDNILGRFARLEELIVVDEVLGNGKVGSFKFLLLAPDWAPIQMSNIKSKLESIQKKTPTIKIATIKNAVRQDGPRTMTESEKEVARTQRQLERERVAPVRDDEDFAIRSAFRMLFLISSS
jgi:hypothetical protein